MLGAIRILGPGRLLRGMSAVVAALVLAGGNGAIASAGHRGGPGASTPAGIISTFAGGPGGPGKATGVALTGPCDVAFAGGQLYLADGVVRKINARSDWLTTPAGTGAGGSLAQGGPATGSSLNDCGVAVDHQGNLVTTDMSVQRVLVVAARTGRFYHQKMTAGDLYVVAGGGHVGLGDGGPATRARLNSPMGVAVDGAGNLVVADQGDERIRVVAAGTGTFYGQAMTAGDIYTVAGNGTPGFAGDGGPATAAELNKPTGVAADAVGNLLICDQLNNRIRVVAAGTGTFYGQAMTAGDIYTVAGNGRQGTSGDGGPAIKAQVGTPGGATVDAAGNLLIAAKRGPRVWVVAARTGTFYGQAMTAGDIYAIAGGGTGGLGDGGPATSAVFLSPGAVAVNAAGNVLIADTGNKRVRMVTG